MTKKVLVLVCEGDDAYHTSPGIDDYRQYFNFDSVSITCITPKQLLFRISDGEVFITIQPHNISLQDFQHIIIRGSVQAHSDIVHSVALFARYQKIPCWNGYVHIFARSKLSQAVRMALLGVSTPDTIFSLDREVEKNAIYQHISFPCIVKDWLGTRGANNYLVKSRQELSEVLKDSRCYFISQQFIPSDGDYRYLRIGSEAMVISRKASGSHLSNTSKGGKAEIVGASVIPPQAVEQAVRYANSLELFIYGADIIFDTRDNDRFYFLEFNWQPQILSGAFVKEKQAMMQRALLA